MCEVEKIALEKESCHSNNESYCIGGNLIRTFTMPSIKPSSFSLNRIFISRLSDSSMLRDDDDDDDDHLDIATPGSRKEENRRSVW